ncbi:SDR family oxidoreductase [Fibrisoma montanum]|uniref:SDR family oxidoreductase n=1 Tax=Fibrisoma montanum TaxID=2305895 RepID=UPI001E3FCBAF|nr:SDR family oxidoreductase [Fibrisoma montanum]
MNVSERILISGATGNVGLETLRELMQRPDTPSVEIIAGVQDPEQARKTIAVQPDGFVKLDFTDAATFGPALKGVSRLLLVRPPQLADVDKYFKPFIDVVKQKPIRQIVFLSLQGVENNALTPHYKIEKLIVEAGIPYTFLRPSFFMQNLSTTHRDEIRLRNEIFVPAGNGQTSFVDVRDIGAVAALVLTSNGDEHLNKGYELTGSEALTYGEVAELLTKVLGRAITYRNPSVPRFIWQK